MPASGGAVDSSLEPILSYIDVVQSVPGTMHKGVTQLRDALKSSGGGPISKFKVQRGIDQYGLLGAVCWELLRTVCLIFMAAQSP